MPVLALAIVAIPPSPVIGPLVTHHGVYSNWGDVAANELSVQNAAHLHQAVGPYDRFGWFHPGPMFFYLLAIPYVLMDWNGAALEVGAGLINLAAAVGIVGLVARRAGGKAALGTAAVVCAFEFALRAPHITNSWGPEVIVLPAALFFVLCADLAAGAVWSLVGAVAVGSFLAPDRDRDRHQPSWSACCWPWSCGSWIGSYTEPSGRRYATPCRPVWWRWVSAPCCGRPRSGSS